MQAGTRTGQAGARTGQTGTRTGQAGTRTAQADGRIGTPDSRQLLFMTAMGIQGIQPSWLLGSPLRGTTRPAARPTARAERRGGDRRQLLLAEPPAIERRLFDRRASDRDTNARPAARRTSATRKGLIVDVYV